jgi:hypothetical protein
MDKDLKAFFLDQQAFITHAVGELEKRVGARFDGVEDRLDKLEGTVQETNRLLKRIGETAG